MKTPEHIIIVGGGAAGLMSASLLIKKGFRVTILEANNRLGGRIHTLHPEQFIHPVERGVEFIHGNLPLTMDLISRARISPEPVEGNMYRVEKSVWKKQEEFAEGWQELMEKMNEVQTDLSLDDFLHRFFSDSKYDLLKKTATRFAQGFDLADTSKASVLSLRQEWMEEADEQFRLPPGFDHLVKTLESQCRESKAVIHLESIVNKITWSNNDVTVHTTDGRMFVGNKVILTLSAGLMQADRCPILFQPTIQDHVNAFENIGFGSVVKVSFQFEERFWEEKKKNIGFIFSGEAIPTWWTQLPSSSTLLTGWAGGPQAWEIENKNDEQIFDIALKSLANIFEKSVKEIQSGVTASFIANWKKDPYTMGAYSYNLPGSAAARKILDQPVDNTLFFAGEALYEGASPGTVEAALVSGKNVAERILNYE